ncbi:hypothetical protein JCM15519_18150 [Fundidesulfovibrio butyratiphilus]
MRSVYELATHAYEPMAHAWDNPRTEKAVTSVLVIIFLAGLACIQAKRWGLLPPVLAALTPDNHFHAVGLAFTLVLIMEVLGLIFTMPCSFSRSVGKQFEILSLILLRNSFKELVNLPEPIGVGGDWSPILRLSADGCGALVIFAILGVYYKIQNPDSHTAKSGYARYAFVASKKILSMALLLVFALLGLETLYQSVFHHRTIDFFDTFYTVLIFADILIVLLAQRFLPGYEAVFRNSGYALSTLLIRLALAAPPFYNTLLGIGAALFAVFLTLTYNAFYCKRVSRTC